MIQIYRVRALSECVLYLISAAHWSRPFALRMRARIHSPVNENNT